MKGILLSSPVNS